jgi:hypothetical protein
MQNDHLVRLTSSEISNIWTQYMNDSMAVCVFTHFIQHTSDEEIREVLEFAIQLSKRHLADISDFFKNEDYPVPIGFNVKDDVFEDAPPLFTDSFYIIYTHVMTLHGLVGYAGALGSSVREDQINHFTKCNMETMELYRRCVKVMLNKGIVSRAPFLNPPDKVGFVQKQSFLTGWLGDHRPLNAIEISGIYFNMQKTAVKVVLELGFSQVAKSKELRKYFHRGANICEKQFDTLNSVLSEDHLPAPNKWSSEVTNSTTPPFSDKLMIYQILGLVSTAMGYFGLGLSVAQRRDLAAKYELLIAEIGLYAEDGAQLMIDNGWLEQPPMADDRDELANLK